MPHHGPQHERVDLTAYERRQLELIAEALANDEPSEPPEVDGDGETDGETDANGTDAEVGRVYPLWVLLTIVGAWITVVLGVVFGVTLLVVLGIASTSGAIALYWTRGRHRRR